MEIITFSTQEAGRWQTPRVGALLNSEYLLNFERVFDGPERPANHLGWLDMDGPWFQKSREKYESLAHDPGALAQAADEWLVNETVRGLLACSGASPGKTDLHRTQLPRPRDREQHGDPGTTGGVFEIFYGCDCAG